MNKTFLVLRNSPAFLAEPGDTLKANDQWEMKSA
jgi:hypothetical protein